MQEELSTHKNMKAEGAYKDLIDAYLQEMDIQKNNSASFFNGKNIEN